MIKDLNCTSVLVQSEAAFVLASAVQRFELHCISKYSILTMLITDNYDDIKRMGLRREMHLR